MPRLPAISMTMSASSLMVTMRSVPEVQRLAVVGVHQAVDAFDAVVDVAERARLLAVAPDLDLAAVVATATLRHIAAGAFSRPPS